VLAALLKRYLKPYNSIVWLSFLLLLIQAVANLYLPNLNAELINNGVAKGNISYIWHIGLIMLAASIIVIAVSIWIAYLASQISMKFGRDLRGSLFQHVETFSAKEMGKFGAPSLITRNTNDIQQVQMLVYMGLTMMIAAPITAIGSIIMAIKTNAHLSFLLLVVVPILSIFITLVLRSIVPLFRLNQTKLDKINLILREQIAGVRVIRAFVKRAEEEQRFAGASADLMATTLRVARTFSVMFPVLNIIMNGSSVAVIWFGGKLVASGSMQIGSLTAFLSYLMQILGNVMMAVMMSMMIPRASASAERIQEIFDTETSISENEKAIAVAEKTGRVEFKNVEFKYPGAEHSILENITFSATPGEFTAIIGGTGSGKSTLLNLIPRFMDVTSGSVSINGVDVRDQVLESVWSQIGFVPQRSLLFKGTIRDNLKYGKSDASDAEIWSALEIAQARDFVAEQPDKLDAPVAQGGTNFSGGQRQRLALARAIIRKPQIYLLDDSFSALDYTTDSNLRQALRSYAADATLIVIAQRVSTILNAEKIVVLDKGKIVGVGNHSELMASCDTYKEIVLSQLSPEEAA
jgi:ATP-binding cassette, subfamily B, multidrug efflux pump